MGFTAIPALAIGTGIFGTATSFTAARQQNQAIRRSMDAQGRATAVQQEQLRDAASLEKLKAQREAAQIEGRLRVAAGEAGVGLGGSYGALIRQNDANAATNQAIIDRNYQSQLAAVRSGFEANIARLSAGVSNPLLAAFSGGVTGVSTGLSIEHLAEELEWTEESNRRLRDAPTEYDPNFPRPRL